MTKSPYSIFFDDGGVINDNDVRGPQWWRLIGEYFVPKYGKTLEEWKAANVKFIDFEVDYWNELLENKELVYMQKFLDEYDVKWVTIMFTNLGIKIPDQEECIKIARDAYSWIIPQVKSAYDGMIEVIRYLSKHFNLYTASGTDYRTLYTYYKSQGIENSFTKLLGSDTVGVFKSHPSFFDRLYAMTDVDPKMSILIDDKEKVLDLAQKRDPICILSNMSGKSEISGKYPVFNNPQELLDIISEITNVNLSNDFIQF